MRRMSKLLFNAALILGAVNLSPVGATRPADVAGELMRIEQRLAKSILDKDLATYKSLLAEDWTTIDLTGRVLTRAQVIEEFASQDRQVEEVSIDDMKVKELGGAAVLTGRTTAVGSYK